MPAVSKSLVLSYLHKLVEAQNHTNNALTLRNDLDAVALLFHALMLGLEFRWIATGHRSVRPDMIGDNFPKFPIDWNDADDMVSFTYTHPQSTLTFMVKFLKVHQWTHVLGFVIEEGILCAFKLKASDIVKQSMIFPLVTSDAMEAQHGEDWIYQALDPCISAYQLNIVQKLLPGLNKPGYEEIRSPASADTSGAESSPSRGRGGPPPHTIPPYIYPSPSTSGPVPPFPYVPGEIGRSDLDIFTPMTPSGGMVIGPYRPSWVPSHEGDPAEGYRGPRSSFPTQPP